jgi:hypothetical protein
MGRSWVSASVRVPFTPVRVGHTFGGGGRRSSTRKEFDSTTFAVSMVLIAIGFALYFWVYTLIASPLIIAIALAIWSERYPDAGISQWWIGLNDHFRSDKRALKNRVGENDITIETGTK